LHVELIEVVAKHVLVVLGDETSSARQVVMKIGKPQPFPDGRDYFCPWQITGRGDEKVRHSGEINAIQALHLAIVGAGADLFALNESCGRRLRWDGDKHGDLGNGGIVRGGAATEGGGRCSKSK
jgi:hypothetical protein